MLLFALSSESFAYMPYWNNPRIHNMGNGKIHATFARFATDLIDNFAYNGVPVRKQILENYINATDTVVDFCCGTGTSTKYGATGIDTSAAMISEAKWVRGPGGNFAVGNAETWGETNSVDSVTIMYALHEIPRDARIRIINNAMRIARRQVVICDISPRYIPTKLMLTGEPYMLEYQKHILDDLDSFRVGTTIALDELIEYRVFICTICLV